MAPMHNDFDVAATQYDHVFTFSKIGIAQRHLVFKYLAPTINTSKKLAILELNCGTGEDAIQLANLGHHVIATDISENMLRVAKNKTYPKNLTFKVQDINLITEHTFNNTFDLIFSNFGGLNCLSKSQLDLFFKQSVNLLKPNGKLILVIMPKNCLWELIYFSLKGNFKKAKRRNTSKSVVANLGDSQVSTWYYNPGQIVSLSKKLYIEELIKPIGLFIPPSYLETSLLTKKPMFNILIKFEQLFNASLLSKYADHFLIQLTKR